jgi:hypothetical protein
VSVYSATKEVRRAKSAVDWSADTPHPALVRRGWRGVVDDFIGLQGAPMNYGRRLCEPKI